MDRRKKLKIERRTEAEKEEKKGGLKKKVRKE